MIASILDFLNCATSERNSIMQGFLYLYHWHYTLDLAYDAQDITKLLTYIYI